MTFLRVAGFSMLVVLGYTFFTNVVPQVESNPPAEEAVDTGALDRPGQIAWGARLFSGKGTCTLCHNALGRAPDLLAIGLAAALPARIADPRYEGRARGLDGDAAIETYLRESMLEPSAFVVAGFGKKGTADTQSPMRDVSTAPISLSGAEIDALIAFLQDRSGGAVTVPLPGAETGAAAEDEGEGEEIAATAEAAIEKFGCAACHDLMESGAEVGPPLAGVGGRLDRERLVRAILEPDAEVAEGFEADLMPRDYAEEMRVSELELLLDYLAGLAAREAGQ